MAYICTKNGECGNCTHFRFDADKQDNVCWAQVDEALGGADYELAFYRQVNTYKRMCGVDCDAIGIAIRAKNGYADDWGLPEYSTITVNLPGVLGDEPELCGIKNTAYMDVNKFPELVDKLLELRVDGEPVAVDTGFTYRSGFVVYPLFRFSEKWLRSLPVMHGALGTYDKYSEQYVWEFDEEDETK